MQNNDMALLDRVSLTTVNKMSLVLYSPQNGCSPGVLFCADSDLKGLRFRVYKNDLITVPHHGSNDNRQAYEVINEMSNGYFDSLVWVRSDSLNCSSRPCQAFKNLESLKFCTNCKKIDIKQSIEFYGYNQLWNSHNNCLCCLVKP
jgi:hypothetical protein